MNPSHTFATAGTFDVSVAITTANGTSTSNKSVTILQGPVANAISNQSVCIAANGTNAISDTSYENTSNPQIIYARVTNNLDLTCSATTSFSLIVRSKPSIVLSDNFIICKGTPLTITAPTGFSSYNWSNGSLSETATFSMACNYSLTVTKNYGDAVCSNVKTFILKSSNAATITNVIATDWTESDNIITILVTGDGDYEYSIDGFNYQNSNQFSGLNNGETRFYIRDKNNCGIISDSIFLLMYPRFFTPNGDGYNDTWKINFSETEPNMKITIFDRFGKLIKSFNDKNNFWDGTLNGLSLPSSDYWFTIKRENGKEYKGHFSLKR